MRAKACRLLPRCSKVAAVQRCEEIFKCARINWALWRAASLLTGLVPVSLLGVLAICTVSTLIYIHHGGPRWFRPTSPAFIRMSCAYRNITQADGCGAAHLRIFWTSLLWAKCETSLLNDKEILCRMAVVWPITFLSRWKGAETEVTVAPLGSNVYFPCKSRHRPSFVVVARMKEICTAKLHKAVQPSSAADTQPGWVSIQRRRDPA